MIAFIDTEVSLSSQRVADYGAIRDDGAVLHTHSEREFLTFIENCDIICGHNIIGHDLKYLTNLNLESHHCIVDTLYLSPLLFPRKPYHHLVKDDKLQVDELNNPVNDALKSRDLFHDEVAAWQQLSPSRQSIYYHLLSGSPQFRGFFQYLSHYHCDTQLFTNGGTPPSLTQLLFVHNGILPEYENKICHHANILAVAHQYPIELAYSLAVIGADDLMSLTPPWVIRNYPKVANVMNFLCNTPCGNCEYCRRRRWPVRR